MLLLLGLLLVCYGLVVLVVQLVQLESLESLGSAVGLPLTLVGIGLVLVVRPAWVLRGGGAHLHPGNASDAGTPMTDADRD